MNECRYLFMNASVSISLNANLSLNVSKYMNTTVCMSLLMSPSGVKI